MKKVVSMISILMIIFIAGCQPAEIDLNGKKDVYLNVYDEYIEEGATISKGELITVGEVDTNKIGTYVIKYQNEDGSVVVERTVHVVDTVKPIIEFKENPKDYVFLGEEFKLPNVTVTDNYDENLSHNVTNSVDTSKVGEYDVSYTAVDSSGNEANTVILTIKVLDPEPKIVLNGSSEVTIFNTDEYVEKGAKGYDALGQELDVTVDGVVENEVGVYELTYSVTDSYGNSTEVIRTVRVGEMSNLNFESFSSVIPSIGGGYIVYDHNNVQLQKFKDGEELFRTNSILPSGVGTTLVEDSEGNIIVAYNNSESYISKYSSNGEEIWTFKRNGTESISTNYLVESDTGYFYMGYQGGLHSIIYGLLDKDGNFIWENTITSENQIYVDDAVFYDNHLYFIYDSPRSSNPIGVKVSKDGNLEEYSISDGNVSHSADNISKLAVSEEYGLVGLAQTKLFTVDKNYNKEVLIDLPSKTFPDFLPINLETLDDGSFLIVTYGDVYNIKTNGEIIFNKEYPGVFNAYVGMGINENDLIVEFIPEGIGVDIYLFENVHS